MATLIRAEWVTDEVWEFAEGVAKYNRLSPSERLTILLDLGIMETVQPSRLTRCQCLSQPQITCDQPAETAREQSATVGCEIG